MNDVRSREILSTERLILRSTSEDDFRALHEKIFSDADVVRFVFAARRFSLDESANFIRGEFNCHNNDLGLSSLIEKSSGEVIGFSGLEPCAVLGADDLELGFVLAKSAWGNGYALEVGKAQIDFGLRRMGRRRLLALAHRDIARSIRVIVKLGMRHEADATVEGRGIRRVYSIDARLGR